jgi:uncharacterized protein YutE (UPF0331/DUF86 family)
MGRIGVLDPEFAREFAAIAGFRNDLVHEYVELDWDPVYRHLAKLDDLEQFVTHLLAWLSRKDET